jgi:hypothetical protein
MRNNYYLPININRNDAIKSTWNRPIEFIDSKDTNYAKEILTEEFYTKLTTIDDITNVMVFNSHQNYYPTEAHIDITQYSGIEINPSSTNVGLNIVFDDSTDIKGTMRWYSLKDSTKNKKVEFTSAKTPYLSYATDQLNLEAEYCIGELVTLVRTNVPHAVSSGNKPRTCISLRFRNNMDWVEAFVKFNKMFNQNN